MENKSVYVYLYTVYWFDGNIALSLHRLSHKSFSLKRDAKRFARKHKSDNSCIKPWIIRTICLRTAFRSDVDVEVVTSKKEIDAHLSLFDEKTYKRIRY